MRNEELNKAFRLVDDYIFDCYRDGTITRAQALSIMRKVARRLDVIYNEPLGEHPQKGCEHEHNGTCTKCKKRGEWY